MRGDVVEEFALYASPLASKSLGVVRGRRLLSARTILLDVDLAVCGRHPCVDWLDLLPSAIGDSYVMRFARSARFVLTGSKRSNQRSKLGRLLRMSWARTLRSIRH